MHQPCIYINFTDDIYPALRGNFIIVSRDYNIHRINNVNPSIMLRGIYELGITECKTVYGNIVKTYDLERGPYVISLK